MNSRQFSHTHANLHHIKLSFNIAPYFFEIQFSLEFCIISVSTKEKATQSFVVWAVSRNVLGWFLGKIKMILCFRVSASENKKSIYPWSCIWRCNISLLCDSTLPGALNFCFSYVFCNLKEKDQIICQKLGSVRSVQQNLNWFFLGVYFAEWSNTLTIFSL